MTLIWFPHFKAGRAQPKANRIGRLNVELTRQTGLPMMMNRLVGVGLHHLNHRLTTGLHRNGHRVPKFFNLTEH